MWSSASGGTEGVASSSYVDRKGRLVDADGYISVGKTGSRSKTQETTGKGNYTDVFIDYQTVEFPNVRSVHLLSHQISDMVEKAKPVILKKTGLEEISYETRLFISALHEKPAHKWQIRQAISNVAANVKQYHPREMVCRFCKQGKKLFSYLYFN